MPPTRRTFRTLAVTGAALGATLLAVPSATAATAAPVLTVTPDTGLSDGQKVTVSGTGYPAGAQVAVAECDLDFSQRASCAAGSKTAIVKEDGTFSAEVTVNKAFTGYDPSTGAEVDKVDCAAQSCGIATVDVTDVNKVLGVKEISFT
ncbi:enediyne antibiotic chromoprotein [Streptomyces sp. NPDC048172]|uniref:enediyne antibiotic chromoprotein n=1 Tax=Streptomyces sp. NPDC048172 TaxID=3365505 RepID=UPI0037109485